MGVAPWIGIPPEIGKTWTPKLNGWMNRLVGYLNDYNSRIYEVEFIEIGEAADYDAIDPVSDPGQWQGPSDPDDPEISIMAFEDIRIVHGVIRSTTSPTNHLSDIITISPADRPGDKVFGWVWEKGSSSPPFSIYADETGAMRRVSSGSFKASTDYIVSMMWTVAGAGTVPTYTQYWGDHPTDQPTRYYQASDTRVLVYGTPYALESINNSTKRTITDSTPVPVGTVGPIVTPLISDTNNLAHSLRGLEDTNPGRWKGEQNFMNLPTTPMHYFAHGVSYVPLAPSNGYANGPFSESIAVAAVGDWISVRFNVLTGTASSGDVLCNLGVPLPQRYWFIGMARSNSGYGSIPGCGLVSVETNGDVRLWWNEGFNYMSYSLIVPTVAPASTVVYPLAELAEIIIQNQADIEALELQVLQLDTRITAIEADYVTGAELTTEVTGLQNQIDANDLDIALLEARFPLVTDDLADVDTTTTAPSDGDVLVYDAAEGKWLPAASTPSVSTLGGLSDVDLTGLVDDQTIEYDAGSSTWLPNGPYQLAGAAASAHTALQDAIEALGVWSDYTPTLTNFSGTVLSARWTRIGDTVHVEFEIELTSAVSGIMAVGLPVARIAGAGNRGLGQLTATDASSGGIKTAVVASNTANNVVFRTNDASSVVFNTSSPFTWASGDLLKGSLVYEAA